MNNLWIRARPVDKPRVVPELSTGFFGGRSKQKGEPKKAPFLQNTWMALSTLRLEAAQPLPKKTQEGLGMARAMVRTVQAVAFGSMALGAAAQGLAIESQPSLYLELGQTSRRGTTTSTATVGLRIPTSTSFFNGRLSLVIDAYASHWHGHAAPGEREDFGQVGLVPMFRWRFDEGRSPWFVEAGIGASYLLHRYHTVTKTFGTRWNFSDHLGVGHSFGARQQHTVGVYVKHVSNGGLRSPNPGETFYLVRYSYAL